MNDSLGLSHNPFGVLLFLGRVLRVLHGVHVVDMQLRVQLM